MRLTRVFSIVALAAMASRCQPAHAGLIEWTYSSTYASASDPTISASFIRNGGSGTDGSWFSWMNYIGQPTTIETGSTKIFTGYALPQIDNAALQDPPTWDPNFRLTLTLADTASSTSGSVTFTGYFVMEDSLSSPVTMQYTSQSEQSLVLGGNRYEIELPFKGGAEYADVVVTAVVPSPEPATLLMSVIGISGTIVAVRRMRRLLAQTAF
jgi:hypothetical protein